MENAVEQALIRIETLDEQIALLDTVLIPQSEASLHATQTALRDGPGRRTGTCSTASASSSTS